MSHPAYARTGKYLGEEPDHRHVVAISERRTTVMGRTTAALFVGDGAYRLQIQCHLLTALNTNFGTFAPARSLLYGD